MTQKSIGDRGEAIAVWYLRAKGYQIIERNFFVRGGEIDIIARQGKTLVFIEVKTRSSSTSGYPEEMVTSKKLERLHFAMACYLQRHRTFPPHRLDVIAIAWNGWGIPIIRHIQAVEGGA